MTVFEELDSREPKIFESDGGSDAAFFQTAPCRPFSSPVVVVADAVLVVVLLLLLLLVVVAAVTAAASEGRFCGCPLRRRFAFLPSSFISSCGVSEDAMMSSSASSIQ